MVELLLTKNSKRQKAKR